MFTPVLPAGGLTGWRFLERTMDRQKDIFATSAAVARDTDYFQDRIGKVRTAEELVSDRRLLRVALGAIGLQEDIDSRALIRKVLESNTLDPGALANRLGDRRYARLSEAFGFGNFATPRTVLSDFGAEIVARYRDQQFEVSVGDQDQTLRLALNARRELAELAAVPSSDATKWFTILGTPPLRSVLEGALGLPESFRQLDIDRQFAEIRDIASTRLGVSAVADFADKAVLDRTLERFILRQSASEFAARASGSIALDLLRGIR